MDRVIFALAALVVAYILDYFIGDPRSWPHPVRLLGKCIEIGERIARGIFKTSAGLKVGGALILLVTGLVSAAVVIVLLGLAYSLHPAAGFILEVYIIFAALAGGDLRNHVLAVKRKLENSNISKARTAVALLVSRDTAGLNENGVSRAALESLFENSADGLVAPLFYTAIGGPAAAVFYKTVNTLDSMLGYKTEELKDIGFFAAKTDDILSFIPARLTAICIILAGLVHGKWQQGLKVLLADRGKHQSPNSAWPMAAAAGVLGVGFGGRDYFRGEVIERPRINAAGKAALAGDITRGLVLFRSTSILALFVTLLFTYWIRFQEVMLF